MAVPASHTNLLGSQLEHFLRASLHQSNEARESAAAATQPLADAIVLALSPGNLEPACVGDLSCPFCAGVLYPPVTFACGITVDEACALYMQECPRCHKSDCRPSPSYSVASVVAAAFPAAKQAAQLCAEARSALFEECKSSIESNSSSEDTSVVDFSTEAPKNPVDGLVEQSLAAEPSSHAYCIRAQAYFKQGDLLGARVAADVALQMAPLLAPAIDVRARVELAQSSFAKAFGLAAAGWIRVRQSHLLTVCLDACTALMAGGNANPAQIAMDLARELEERLKSLPEPPATPVRTLPEDVRSLPGFKDELECRLCVAVMHVPVTTPCGHSFCRSCLSRALDHTPNCPLCRHDLSEYLARRNFRKTDVLASIIESRFGEVVAQRVEAEAREMSENLPIFVCALALPGVPCPLHIFEPRYRLMMRRAMESTRCFGMCAMTHEGPAEYGTQLHIDDLSYFPDGRSLVNTTGRDRFRVIEWGSTDGYATARVEWITDEDAELPAALLERARATIDRLRAQTSVWQNIIENVCEPPTDAGLLSFWFAHILDLRDSGKYALLRMRSARERLEYVLSRTSDHCHLL